MKHSLRLAAARLAAVTLGITLLAFAHPADADAKAVRIEKADRPGGKVLAYVEPYTTRKGKARLYVEFRDGSAWRFTPCRYEDSNNCFWDAQNRGNGIGNSFVALRGKRYYL